MKQDNILLNSFTQEAPTHEALKGIFNYPLYEAPHFIEVNGKRYGTDKKTILRTDTNEDGIEALGEVGKAYRPLSCGQVIEHTRPITESGLVIIDSAGSLFHGAKRFISWKVGDAFEPVPGDLYVPYLMFFDSVDGSTSVGYCRTIVRVVCRNKFRQALSKGVLNSLRARHKANVVQNLDKIQDAINLITLEFMTTKENLKDLAKVVIGGEEQVKRLVKVIFSTIENDPDTVELNRKGRSEDAILRLFESGMGQDIPGVRGTGLALFNAITEFTNHERGNSSTEETRTHEVLFGTAQAINSKAMSTLLALR